MLLLPRVASRAEIAPSDPNLPPPVYKAVYKGSLVAFDVVLVGACGEVKTICVSRALQKARIRHFGPGAFRRESAGVDGETPVGHSDSLPTSLRSHTFRTRERRLGDGTRDPHNPIVVADGRMGPVEAVLARNRRFCGDSGLFCGENSGDLVAIDCPWFRLFPRSMGLPAVRYVRREGEGNSAAPRSFASAIVSRRPGRCHAGRM